jgi:hypothetical protein
VKLEIADWLWHTQRELPSVFALGQTSWQYPLGLFTMQSLRFTNCKFKQRLGTFINKPQGVAMVRISRRILISMSLLFLTGTFAMAGASKEEQREDIRKASSNIIATDVLKLHCRDSIWIAP